MASATVRTDDLRDGARLAFIKRAVESLLEGVEMAALEGYAYHAVGHVFELGEIGGVLKVLLIEREIPYVTVAPVLVKKFATGSAHADKHAMILAAGVAGFVTRDDDQADAFFLARIALAYAKNATTHRCEMEVLHTLRNSDKVRARPRRPRRLIKNAI